MSLGLNALWVSVIIFVIFDLLCIDLRSSNICSQLTNRVSSAIWPVNIFLTYLRFFMTVLKFKVMGAATTSVSALFDSQRDSQFRHRTLKPEGLLSGFIITYFDKLSLLGMLDKKFFSV